MMIRKIAWTLAILSTIAMVAAIVFVLPDTVAIHYNVAGEADAWGSKWVYLLFGLIPLILIGVYEIYRRHRKEHPNYRMEEKLIPVISMVFIPFFWIMLFSTVESQTHMQPRFFCPVIGILGLLMVFLSNYMGKIRQNPHLGIRIPWTLKNEKVWNKTHRLGGITGVIGGSIMIAGSILGMLMPEHAFAWSFGSLIPGLLLTVAVPTVYSFALYRRLKKEGNL